MTGLIPARAGNTRPPKLPRSAHRAHPRSRGEHTSWPATLTPAGGSSPLARGTHTSSAGFPDSDGLIPARAGNTRGRLPGWSARGAHPRSRGEHPGASRPSLVDEGSSPLARGTPLIRLSQVQIAGLIPARAGNTCRLYCLPEDARAHPRSRGEHHPHAAIKNGAGGSSPLARGTLSLHRSGCHGTGLIPARAGNT